ncbi:MAG TPA: 4-hydroxybenzoate 3-monooxygenase [Vicinamibacterales bacterium]|nr:4-hydroxybenzoate 3-monooxygenase [Vicinamibacterales bacterium]
MISQRTQVAIVGAGPAGLMLGHLLHRHGIDSVIVENRGRQHVIDRVRAGVLEQGTVDLMNDVGVGERLNREGLRHGGFYIAFAGARHHLDMAALTGGRAITIYGQNEVVKDLIAAREASARPLVFEADDVRVDGLTTQAPALTYSKDGDAYTVRCDYIAGCDGFHGVCRPSIPAEAVRVYERTYPFGWLGILAEAPPSSDELVYSLHDRGFALFSMRSPAVTRLYLQCAPEEDLGGWTDDRIWGELGARLATNDGWRPNEGPILQKGVTGMRSFVVEPMRYGRLFLAGDAAHIVPPTGAKGLNLAMADVYRLAFALTECYRTGSQRLLERYSDRALGRTWRAQRFSFWMTSMLHRADDENAFDYRRQLADLEYLFSSPAAMTSLAESYAGAPFDHA